MRFLLAGSIGLALFTATLLAIVLAIATRRAVKGLIQRTRELERESKLRHDAEETLRQSQKMEAVGQLTGGIAHDFNNLLTIIIGNLDTMKRLIAEMAGGASVTLSKPLEAALKGAWGAAQLTHRLLAFSRRQALESARLDLNRLVSGMLDMLKRTLGSQIEVEAVLGGGLWPTLADANQLENVLLNLSLNAKDAMPNGGSLTIETANTYLDEAYARRFGDVESGNTSFCASSTPARASHPTCSIGLQAFLHHEGGGRRLGSRPRHGAWLRQAVRRSCPHLQRRGARNDGEDLPAASGAGGCRQCRSRGQFARRRGAAPRAEASETILLLVEDNEGVRVYAKGVLEEFGYRVLEAADAKQALGIVAGRPRIDVLFTDVVLPGLTGRVLAQQIKEIYPELPVLFTTGYTRNAIVHQGRLDPTCIF
ncbi:MAG: response regulator [Methyloceanibacter sp.]|uniref:response regulator n=1 Tax=Methyloceanibacter sp. TaxID=1965321 RepID=UPI003D9BEFF6